MRAMIVIQDDHIGFDIYLLVHHLDRLPEQEGCRGDLCPYPVLIDGGILDIYHELRTGTNRRCKPPPCPLRALAKVQCASKVSAEAVGASLVK